MSKNDCCMGSTPWCLRDNPESILHQSDIALWRHHVKGIGIFDIRSELTGLLIGADVLPPRSCPKLKCWINCILDYPNHPRINCDITGLPTDCDNLQISGPSDFGYSQALFGCWKFVLWYWNIDVNIVSIVSSYLIVKISRKPQDFSSIY